MTNYIHLNTILKYIQEVEGVDFQIVDSEKYGIKGMTSFKAIIPKSFKVSKVELSEDIEGFALYNVSIKNDAGVDAMEGSNILLWNSELYSTKKEKAVCISDDSIENGILIFENFNSIPPFVDSLEIMRHA